MSMSNDIPPPKYCALPESEFTMLLAQLMFVEIGKTSRLRPGEDATFVGSWGDEQSNTLLPLLSAAQRFPHFALASNQMIFEFLAPHAAFNGITGQKCLMFYKVLAFHETFYRARDIAERVLDEDPSRIVVFSIAPDWLAAVLKAAY